jgi:hypothetical protein
VLCCVLKQQADSRPETVILPPLLLLLLLLLLPGRHRRLWLHCRLLSCIQALHGPARCLFC